MRDRLDDVLQAIIRAESGLRVSGELEWDVLKHIIELMEMHDKMEWVKSYYTEEQLADLKSRGTPEVLAQAEKDWKQLIAEVETALDEDPAGARAQALVDRWSSLIEHFTGGDAGSRRISNGYIPIERTGRQASRSPLATKAAHLSQKRWLYAVSKLRAPGYLPNSRARKAPNASEDAALVGPRRGAGAVEQARLESV